MMRKLQGKRLKKASLMFKNETNTGLLRLLLLLTFFGKQK